MMKYLIIFLGLVVLSSSSSSDFAEENVLAKMGSSALFQPGKHYVYSYSTTVTTGTKDYVSFATSVNLTGELHIEGGAAGVISVQLKDVQVDLPAGGNFKINLLISHPLSEPFSVKSKGGKVIGLTVNKELPVWAQNMQKGLASALQLVLARIESSRSNIFYTEEETVHGKCTTEYTLLPRVDDHRVQVRKHRFHHQCASKAKSRVVASGITGDLSAFFASKNVLNSTGVSVYDLEIRDGELEVSRISAKSSLVYNLFGTEGHTQYSFGMMTAVLKQVKSSAAAGSSSIAGPSNGVDVNSLQFTFENDIPQLESLKPFFHHLSFDQNKAADKLVENIQNICQFLAFSKDSQEANQFRKMSPFSLIPIVAAVDYQNLKQVEQRLHGGDITEYQLFLDALVVSGTGSAALVIRDIVQNSNNPSVITRLLASLPDYVRYPTELLVQTLEPILDKAITTTTNKYARQSINLAFASLLGRACMKDGCPNTGMLLKYINIFSAQLDAASNFDERMEPIMSLINMNHPVSALVLLHVAKDKRQRRTVRDAALRGVAPLVLKDKRALRHNLLPIFYDRQEDPEIRTHALMMTLLTTQQKSPFQMAAVLMWTELNPNVRNFVASFYNGLVFSSKFSGKIKSNARDASKILPPWTLSANYSRYNMSDSFDRQYNFGDMATDTKNSSELTAFPHSVYMAFHRQTAVGRDDNYVSFFIRLERVGMDLAEKLMTIISTNNNSVSFDTLKGVFDDMEVVKNDHVMEPFRLEISVTHHNRNVVYFAADQRNTPTYANLIRELKAFAHVAFDKELYRLTLAKGAIIETPNEFGMVVAFPCPVL